MYGILPGEGKLNLTEFSQKAVIVIYTKEYGNMVREE
jgi:hypothetical protein